jgi:hypothetical protein
VLTGIVGLVVLPRVAADVDGNTGFIIGFVGGVVLALTSNTLATLKPKE